MKKPKPIPAQTDTAAASSVPSPNPAVNLKARIHQGHEASPDYSAQNSLLSGASLTDKKSGHAHKGDGTAGAHESVFTPVLGLLAKAMSFFSKAEPTPPAEQPTPVDGKSEPVNVSDANSDSSSRFSENSNSGSAASLKQPISAAAGAVTSGHHVETQSAKFGTPDKHTTDHNAHDPKTVADNITVPEVWLNNVSGHEGHPIALNVQYQIDTAPGVSTVFILSGLPTGSTLSAGTNNGDGTWTLTADNLNGLELNPPTHTSGTFHVRILARSWNSTEMSESQMDFSVLLMGNATAPGLTLQHVTGYEDTGIPLTISSWLIDNDGSEVMHITISNLPAGATLSAGTDDGHGTWTLTTAELTGLQLIPTADYHGDFTLVVNAISEEENTTAVTSGLLDVSILNTADAPTLSAQTASGNEDTAIALTIAVTADSDEVVALTISGVPNGAVLSAGTNNGNGTWTLAASDLTGLTLTPALNSSGNFSLTVVATTSVNGTSASRSTVLPVAVAGVADQPLLTVHAASGNEDTAISLPITATLTDTDGSETLSITIGGVPTGAQLSAGTDNGNGTWTLTPAQLTNLTFTPPHNFNGSLNLTVTATASENGTSSDQTTSLSLNVTPIADVPTLNVTAASGNEDTAIPLSIAAAATGGENITLDINGVPAGAVLSAGTNMGNGHWLLSSSDLAGLTLTPPNNYSGSFNLSVTATATDGASTATRNINLPVSVAGVPDVPTVSIAPASGDEDTPIHLNITAGLSDTDGSETLSVTIGNVPAGATLSAGTNNGNGTWTLHATDLANLTLTAPPGYSGTLNLNVSATASENGQSVSTTPASFGVTVAALADAPTLSVQAANGNENTTIPLVINAALTDSSETLSILIGGIPAGASLTAGHNNGDGTWTVAPADLPGLGFTPAAYDSGTYLITVTATSSIGSSTASTTHSFPINVDGTATTPSLMVTTANGNEDTAVPLSITAALVDTDGSETLSITIGGVPTGAHLSAGTDNGNGTWTLSPAQLSGLTFTPPEHASGTYNLSVIATSHEGVTTATAVMPLAVNITGQATPPDLSVQNASGNEDDAIPLTINAALVDLDGSETLSIVISGLPAGSSLSAGTDNGNGVWTLSPTDLAGLTFTPPSHASGQFHLTVTAISHENGTTASTANPLFVAVGDVASPPTLSAPAAAGHEDSPVALNISAALTDTDGSETLALTISGVPTGATMSAGTDNGNGSWTLAPSDLAGLTLSPPHNYSGSFNLTVTATSSEAGTTADTTALLGVTITGVADTPTLSVQSVNGTEGSAIPLLISAALTDTDGSETLSVVIGNVPAGAQLSAGVNNGNGSWTVAGSSLPGLTLTPPAHYSGTLSLSVTAIASEAGTSSSTGPSSMSVTVDGVADAPTLHVQAASGNEDTAIALSINAALVDTDGSETLSILIGNVPNGAVLSAGTNNNDGTWTLSPSDLAGLTFTPAPGRDGNFNLTVTATSHENATSASTSTNLAITVAGVADTPTLNVQPASGNEDQPIALNISASTADADETISVVISGVPAGASLSAGTNNGNGNWSLTPGQLSNLTLSPPSNWSGNLALTVTATSTEGSSTASTTSPLAVTIAPVADAPTLTVQPASGNEDAAIALNITSALVDTDGSETLALTIAGVPTGSTLSAGTNLGGGVWSVAPAQLAGLTFTPPAGYSGALNLTITATASEGASSASTGTTLAVSITPVANTPTLTVQSASGNEDTAIALHISSALTDTDGSETLSLTLSGVPAGASLSAGTNMGNGVWTVTPQQLAELSLTPPANYSGSFTLSVTAKASESGDTASASAPLTVTVAGVADAPSLSVQTASGDEDTAIALTINAALVDTDGSETLAVSISNVPAGSTFSAGTNLGGGVWSFSPGQLAGLTFTPPVNYSGTLNLSIAATASENGTTATTTTTLGIIVAGVADAPTLSVQAASGSEDHAIPLVINASLTDSSEILAITIGNVPTGSTLSAGTDNGNGTWTLTPAQLTGLSITPPANYSGSFNLNITATSAENGTSVGVSAALPVTVAGIADVPTISVQNASGVEDSAIALNIAAALTDTDGSETLAVTISNVPSGAVLSAGTNNGNGSWTLSAAQLAGLTLTPPANYSGSFNLSVQASASENGTTASTGPASLTVAVAGVADAPVLSVHTANGSEDHPIALAISAGLTDTDGSETLSILIGNVPTGSVLSAGTNNGNGTWTLSAAQLAGLTLSPPSGYSGSFNLSVSATASENGTTATTGPMSMAVAVTGIANTPTLAVLPASGSEDTAIALSITSALTDTDGSETLSLTIAGVPAGATLSAGTNLGGGNWSVSPGQLSGLTLTPPTNYSGSFNLTVTAVSSEDGTTANNTATLSVNIGGVADAPTLAVQNVVAAEDHAIALSISAGLTDTDGSETLSITVSNVPTGATLSAGTNNGGGSWTLSPAQLAGLTLTPPANYSGSFNLAVSATSSENGTTATTQTTLGVTVTGVADAPSLSVTPATGSEDTAVVLNITSALTDTDGSETLSITISGVPTGATLSAGTNNGGGVWTLSAGQLSGLTLAPPANYSGNFNLTVAATSSENSTSATTQATLGVTISGVADTPTLSVSSASGNEGTAIALSISTALTDTDGSEALSITISNVPTGATLSAGTNNGGGNWTLNPAQLAGLTLTPPANYSGSFNLSVTATSSEGGTTASTSSTLHVDVSGVADIPTLSVQSATGAEDHGIPLSINAALIDTDGSEALSVSISGVPSGATLSAGTNMGGGTWTLSGAQLAGLTLTPPANYSGSFNLSVTATSSENSTTAHSPTLSLPVNVTGVADTPTLSVQMASGAEDTAIPLTIISSLVDTDGSETLTLAISGVPTGATLSAGTNMGGGNWSLTPAQLTGLTLTPPANYSGPFSLIVSATSSESGTTATNTATLNVTVTGVADAPTLNVASASGTEDHAIALTITSALTDTDGSETLGITIAGVPTGATLSAGTNNGSGVWTLTAGQLAGLTLTPPHNFSGSLNLSITATSAENGTTAVTGPMSLPITVSGIADAPTLSVQSASGNEDSAIALNISAALTDTDGSEALSITITNVPTGATLSAGTNNGGGSWTLSPGQLAGLTLTPAANYSGSFNLSVSATSSEAGTTAVTGPTSLGVTINGVADAPTLTVQAASGNEDTAIALNIAAALTDTDGSETLGITIAGVPTGATLSAGTNLGNGTWSVSTAQLSGLKITPPGNYSGNFNLTVTATASENGTTATTSGTLAVTVAGVADAPSLSVLAATGPEDTSVHLTISPALLDTDGSEVLAITIAGVPTGAILSAGTNNGGGNWTLTPAQLSGLTITPAHNYSGNFNLTVTATASENGTSASTQATLGVTITGVADTPTLSVQTASGNEDSAIPLTITTALTDTDGSETLGITIAGVPTGATLSAGTNNGSGNWTLTPAQLTGLTITPPANYSGNFNLTVTATSSESSTTASIQSTLGVTVAGVADVPTLSASSASGNEDTAIALSISAALTDTDGSETLGITISGVPTGASLSAGTNLGGGSWSLTSAQLSNLKITPPNNYSGNFSLTVVATASENGTTAISQTTLGVTVGGVADAPSLSVVAASGNEDTAISLNISTALTDTDGSETLGITISGVPTGATLSAGTNLGGGSWSLTPSQLTGLKITPPSNYSGSFNLTVAATSAENSTTATTSSTLGVTVAGVADAPSLSVSAASGNEDTAIALTIAAALTDTDGSEALSITVAGVPIGATLSAGINLGSGNWSLTAAQLSGLKITPPANYSGSFNLTVTATSSENSTTATTQATLGVTVAGVADAPTVSASQANGNEDTAIALTIAAALTDTDGSESLALRISGVPTGATLSAGTNLGGGVWSLTPAQLTGLKITPPANSNADFTLTVTATASENSTTASTNTTLLVRITGVADTPTLTVQAVVNGNEDSAIPLTIASALVDTDGSESLSILVSGLPAGALLSAGTYAGNGSWSLTPAQLTGLVVRAPAQYSGQMNLTVTAISTENDGGFAKQSSAITVNVAPVADQPNLTVTSAKGAEDTAISLNISASLVDSSETLSVVISSVPTGATLSAGTNLGGGSWRLTTAQLTNLKITPALNSDADFTLTVTAISTESDGSTASRNSSLAVTVTGVADAPVATASNVSGASGAQIALTIGGTLIDNDGSESPLTYVIHGMPDGFALTAGINNGDNTWTVTQAQLTGLKLVTPDQYNGQLNLYVSAVAHESDGNTAMGTATPFYARVGSWSTGYLVDLGVGVNVGGIGVGAHVAALPVFDLFPVGGGLLGTSGIYAKEDTTFLIADAPGLLGNPLISAILSLVAKIQFSNIPTDVTFSKGINKGGGVWEFTQADLTNLSMTLPANSDADFTILASAKLLSLVVIDLVSTPVHVMGIADTPTLTATAIAGVEDGSFALNITGALTDTDGSETSSFLVSGMPAGFSLNHGINNGNGTWSLKSADLSGLTVTPTADYSGTGTLTVSHIATEREGDQAVVQSNVSFSVTAVADAPTIIAPAHTGNEDTPIALNFGIALRDTDGSESISAITIAGLPTGASLTNATNNGDGTWSVAPAQINNVQLVPPANWSGDMTLSVSATSRESSNSSTASTNSTLSVHINPVADVPVLNVGNVTDQPNAAISLNISASLVDNDGSEKLSVVISSVPTGAVLSAGLNNGDGTWTLSPNQLSALSITPPEGFHGDMHLTATAHSLESNGDTASAQHSFTVHVDYDHLYQN